MPYKNFMKSSERKKSTVELRIQKSTLNLMGHEVAHRATSAPISDAMLGITTRFNELERTCCKFGTDVDIHRAEIHTIMGIYLNEGIHVGGLAEVLGVTKGSVSELLRRLERKGLVYKAKDPLKMTRINVYLTEKGKTAHNHHLHYHEKLDGLVEKAMGQRTPDQIMGIISFLEEMLNRLNAIEVK